MPIPPWGPDHAHVFASNVFASMDGRYVYRASAHAGPHATAGRGVPFRWKCVCPSRRVAGGAGAREWQQSVYVPGIRTDDPNYARRIREGEQYARDALGGRSLDQLTDEECQKMLRELSEKVHKK